MAIQLESITTLIGTHCPEAVPGNGKEDRGGGAGQKTLLTPVNSLRKSFFENVRSI